MATAAKELVPVKRKSRKIDGRRNNRGTVGNNGGRPAWQPAKIVREFEEPNPNEPKSTIKVKREETQAEAWERIRREVRHYVAIGYPQDVIARLVQPACEPDTLRKHLQFELDNGKLVADAKISGTIFQLAMRGEPSLLRFWARARMGWRDTGEIKVPPGPVAYQLIPGDDW